MRQFPLALSHETRMYACQRLNQILADTQILYALYKKHHWLMRGVTFSQLHLLLDKHADEQRALVDTIAEHVAFAVTHLVLSDQVSAGYRGMFEYETLRPRK